MKLLTFDEAVRLHKEMWTAMQKEYGDCPTEDQRKAFKDEYLKAHGYNVTYETEIVNNCFLCDYVFTMFNGSCRGCPVTWPVTNCWTKVSIREKRIAYFLSAPISEILALPLRDKRPGE